MDLSHAYDSTTLFWPTAAQGWVLNKEAEGETAGGYYYSANNFATAEHGGTHIDAPVHFARGKQSVDQIPLESLMAPVVVIDVTQASAQSADYQVTADDLQRFEQQHGAIPSGTIVLLKTGFASRWPDAARYLGTAERGEAAVAKLHFPGLHPAAAEWLASNRKVKAVGIDTASIDYGQSKLFETHRTLMGRDIPALENLGVARSIAADGCVPDRAADEDRRRQRRAAARRCGASPGELEIGLSAQASGLRAGQVRRPGLACDSSRPG